MSGGDRSCAGVHVSHISMARDLEGTEVQYGGCVGRIAKICRDDYWKIR